MIVSDTKTGPLRVVIEAHGGALILFSPAHRAQVIKRGLREIGNVWLFKWMPKRFTNYAFQLGYRVSGKWRLLKGRHLTAVVPFVGMTPTGGGRADGPWWQRNKAKMADAVRGGRVTASGRDGAEHVTIMVPYGHPIQTEKARVFRTVSQTEMDDLAEGFARRLGNEISGARTVVRNNTMRAIPKAQPRKTSGRTRRGVA